MRYSSAWVDFWREHWCPGVPVWCGSQKLFPDWRSWCCTGPPSGPAVSWPPPPAWLVTAWRSCLSASDRLPLCYLFVYQSKLHILYKYNNNFWCSVSISYWKYKTLKYISNTTKIDILRFQNKRLKFYNSEKICSAYQVLLLTEFPTSHFQWPMHTQTTNKPVKLT